MIDGNIVIDAVAHGYDPTEPNRAEHCPKEMFDSFGSFMHKLGHSPLESREPGFRMTEQEFVCRWSAEALASAFFLESDVDLVYYHHVQYPGFCRDGISRLDTGLELRRLAPKRVFVYGSIDTLGPDPQMSFDLMEEMAELGVSGFKFYPSNGTFDESATAFRHMSYDDPETAYPYFEKARELGITRLAFHKAFPMGPAIEPVRVGDMLTAAVAFPDLTFEIVHAGWAFLEETAIELLCAPNIYANLELSAGLVVRQPRRFAEMIGKLIQLGGHERILYGSGCALAHPDPVLRAFQAFEMPEDLIDGHDFVPVTPEMKADILGNNMARLHGIDTAAALDAIRDDGWARRRAAEGKLPPWTGRRAELRAQEGALV